MGQYYNGEKIGTCENMYYMRMSQAEKLRGAADDDGIKFETYLSDNETRWRFPWPDEDGREKAGLLYSNVTDFDRGFSLPLSDTVKINHCEICVGNQPKSMSGHNVNIFIPCPHSDEFARTGLKMSHGGAGKQYITIRYKAMRRPIDRATNTEIEGVPLESTTLIECARCGQLQRVSREELEEIKVYAREHFEAVAKHSAVSDRERNNAELMASIKKELNDKLEIISRI